MLAGNSDTTPRTRFHAGLQLFVVWKPAPLYRALNMTAYEGCNEFVYNVSNGIYVLQFFNWLSKIHVKEAAETHLVLSREVHGSSRQKG